MRARDRIRRVAYVLRDTRTFAIGIVTPFICLGFVRLLGLQSERGVRVAGVMLAGVGVVVALTGIAAVVEYLGVPGIPSRFVDFWRRLWSAMVHRKVTRVAAGTGVLQLSVNAVGVVIAKQTTSISERLKRLEKQVQEHVDEQTAKIRELERTDAELKASLDREREARAADIEQIAARTTTLATSGIDYQVIGFFWLFAGQVLTTFPAEFARLLGW